MSNNPLNYQIGGQHYKKWTIQPIEFVIKNKLSWFGFVVLKYVMRVEGNETSIEKKIEDIDKIIQYAEFKRQSLLENEPNLQHNNNS